MEKKNLFVSLAAATTIAFTVFDSRAEILPPIIHQFSPAPTARHLRVVVPEDVYPFARLGDRAGQVWRKVPGGVGDYTKVEDLPRELGSYFYNWKERNFAFFDDFNSPLLIDMERDGFQMSESGQGVAFDVLDNGAPDLIQWVADGSNDAFLAIDLNFNGVIDNGGELFGQGTDILSEPRIRKAADGYEALGQFDLKQQGGNADGKITRKDQVWSQLLLWVDTNGDGVSTSDEVSKVSDSVIKRFSLRIKASTSSDESGNLLPYSSWVKTKESNGTKRLKMVDIFFKKI